MNLERPKPPLEEKFATEKDLRQYLLDKVAELFKAEGVKYKEDELLLKDFPSAEDVLSFYMAKHARQKEVWKSVHPGEKLIEDFRSGINSPQVIDGFVQLIKDKWDIGSSSLTEAKTMESVLHQLQALRKNNIF